MLQFTAEKFDDQCLLTKSTIDIPLNTHGQDKLREAALRGGLLSMLASNDATFDENGNYNITVPFDYTLCEDCISPQSSHDYCECSYLFLRLRYNSIEGQWKQYRYAIPSPHAVADFAGPLALIRGMSYTKDRVLLPAIPNWQGPFGENYQFVPPSGSEKSFVLALGPCESEKVKRVDPKEWWGQVPCYGGPDGKGFTHEGVNIAAFSHWPKQEKSSYYYNVGLQYSWSKEYDREKSDILNAPNSNIQAGGFKICGNSTFTALFGPTGYIVFCHDRNVTLPQQSDEDLRVSREWSINPLTQLQEGGST